MTRKVCIETIFPKYFWSFFFFFFCGTEAWTQGLWAHKADALPLESFILFQLVLKIKILWTICLGWPQTVILPISASQAARITGVSHWCPAWKNHSFIHSFSAGDWTQGLVYAKRMASTTGLHPPAPRLTILRPTLQIRKLGAERLRNLAQVHA
jgi:hypothetical protein